MTQADCIFCRIIAGELPSRMVHQDEVCVAFHDINPQAPVHILVVPREHVASLDEATFERRELLGHLLLTAARVANAEGLTRKSSGYRTVINTGAGVGQSVFHLHLHVLGGRPMSWPPG
ncbi:MAG: histidine triad nucleotide-binding protein [Pyrinomonas sp.]|uniref:histidine triad nucleotide-binding protein n=1 Tax=Pyrinomonas sp. TaxID=2080306 RepID=UPI0033191CF1